jgi:4-amino-4-deoxy-L-arabinose transferase-like glycosyltransferase
VPAGPLGHQYRDFKRRPQPFAGVFRKMSSPIGLSRTGWIVALASAWILFGLIGHDPWKADEAYTFGIVVDQLRTGDWVVPTLAGEPFVEKPPLIYLVAGGFVRLFQGILPAHDAARLAAGFFVAVSLLFLGLTAREIHGPGSGSVAVLILLGCLGGIGRMHQLIPDVALLAGVAIGMFGLALARSALWEAGIVLGVGTACAFLAKGLLGPGLLGVTALLLPVFFPAWRTQRYVAILGLAAVIAITPAAIWMHALFVRSPALFNEWLVTNNFGRFLGFVSIGPARNPPGFYAYTLLWYAFPALPLAGLAVWTAWRNPDATLRRAIELPALFAVVVAVVLGAASDSRELYLLPILLPLSLLATPGLIRLPPAGTKAMAASARWGFGSFAAVLWLGWFVLMTGTPVELQSRLLDYQPGFEPSVHWLQTAFAIAATLGAGWVLAAGRASAGHALTQWVCGLTLCWALISTLWLPYLDAGKSYRTMLRSLASQFPRDGCVASLYFGEGQRGLLVYFENLTTVRLELVPDAPCNTLLVQRSRATGAPAPTADWIPVWEGARPGDHNELYRLYRRDVAPGHALVLFPN